MRIRKYHPKDTEWKVKTLIINTWVNALNFWIILFWLKFLKIYSIPIISIDVFPGTLLNDFFAFTIEFALPFGILNYFFIFYKDKYKKIIDKYSAPKRKYAFIYSTTTTLFALLSAVIYIIFK
ncbi:MAG: hypothetical protein PHX08_23435 [Lachnospiraceae bacterium]|nr:hypothetical protein [Lachnospiraceae bacterium]